MCVRVAFAVRCDHAVWHCVALYVSGLIVAIGAFGSELCEQSFHHKPFQCRFSFFFIIQNHVHCEKGPAAIRKTCGTDSLVDKMTPALLTYCT